MAASKVAFVQMLLRRLARSLLLPSLPPLPCWPPASPPLPPAWPLSCAPRGFAVAPGRHRAPTVERPPTDLGRLVNGAITAPRVRVVKSDGTHTVMRRGEALAAAKAAGLDLIQMDATAVPPVCRLASFDGMRGAERAKEKEVRRKAVDRRHADVTKEVRLSCRTEEHDVRVKAVSAAKALGCGHKAKLVVLFRNEREAGDAGAKAGAADVLQRVLEAVQQELGEGGGTVRLDSLPKADGFHSIWCRIALVPAAESGGAATAGGGAAGKAKGGGKEARGARDCGGGAEQVDASHGAAPAAEAGARAAAARRAA